MSSEGRAPESDAGRGFPVVALEGGPRVVRIAPLEAALPGLVAVFTTRVGGVSSPPWASLNLGLHVGDEPEAVLENRRRVWAALGIDGERLVTTEQVHGHTVAVAEDPGRHQATDGLITTTRGLTLIIFCADCTPVFLLDPVTPAVGAVHAGWRGTLAGIAERAVTEMIRRFGSRPGDILGAVGPSIGPCCYEVGPEVIDRATACFGPEVLTPGDAEGGRSHLDLWAANRQSLLEAGLTPEHVHLARLCTACREDLFHSHRRETTRPGGPRPARSGRMAALIRLPEEPA